MCFTLTDKNELRIDYRRHHRQGDAGQPDESQLFQPRRRRPATVLDHELMIAADEYLPDG